MRNLKTKVIFYFILSFLTLTFTNCASKSKAVTTKKETIKINAKDSINDKNILYLVDGKEFPAKDINSLSVNKIHSVTVIKGKEDIKKYTDKKYDGVIIIVLKK